MQLVAATALSGMNAATAALGVAAHNVANAMTPGFQRQVVQPATLPAGGVTTTVERSGSEGASLETDLVGQLQAKNAFLANLAVFKTSDAMAGALLNLRA